MVATATSIPSPRSSSITPVSTPSVCARKTGNQPRPEPHAARADGPGRLPRIVEHVFQIRGAQTRAVPATDGLKLHRRGTAGPRAHTSRQGPWLSGAPRRVPADSDFLALTWATVATALAFGGYAAEQAPHLFVSAGMNVSGAIWLCLALWAVVVAFTAMFAITTHTGLLAVAGGGVKLYERMGRGRATGPCSLVRRCRISIQGGDGNGRHS